MTAGGAGEAHAYGMAGLWTGATLSEPSSGADFDGGNGHRTGWGSAASIDQRVAQPRSGPNLPYQRSADRRDAGDRVPLGRARRAVRQPDEPEPHDVQRRQPADSSRGESAKTPSIVSLPASPPAAAATTMPDPAAAQTRAEKLAVVDLLKNDLARLRTRVGAEDYAKIDAHLEGLLAIERRIAATTTPPEPPSTGCTLPDATADVERQRRRKRELSRRRSSR